ncbi:hypothetical protein ABIE26_002562 [Pedobacter africanus]|uniref:Uncharacterized protein n=1 Tax=Pedobacter africanus TaxID=151894 RepID=A0ACC6KY53_9SPHI|nr:hypothetical protein [Pedobacter africanus]
MISSAKYFKDFINNYTTGLFVYYHLAPENKGL